MKFKGRLTYRNFLDYLSNKLEKKEKHAFEKKIMQDSFESEAFDGLSKLDVSDLEMDMANLTSLMQVRTKDKKRRILAWFPYAASVIILLVLSSVLYYLNQYPVKDEMIGAQMEEMLKVVESPILEPEITKQDVQSADLMEMIEDDLERELSDADEVEEVELMIVSEEEELEERIVPVVKKQDVELLQADREVLFENPKVKKNPSKERGYRAVEERVAGTDLPNRGSEKSVKRAFKNREITDMQIISGKVIDEDNLPLAGVSIVLKESGKAVRTDLDGKFELNISDTSQDYRLVASFIGFKSKELSTKAGSLLVILEADHSELNELVVLDSDSSLSKSARQNSLKRKAQPIKYPSISELKEHLVRELNNLEFKHLHGKLRLNFSFTIDVSGKLSDLKFKNKPDAILMAELERLLLNVGNWYPAKSGGETLASKVKISLSLNFD